MIRGRRTSGSDRITGDSAAQRLEGGRGNDTLIGNGGADTLVGDNGNDRLIARDASGTTGLRGGNGNDVLIASMPGSGQVHMFGMDGNDTLIIDLTKDASRFRGAEQIAYNGHHVYGGTGADTFNFVNAAQARGTIIGRLDDFDPGQDRLTVNGQQVNLTRPGAGQKIFTYKDQQWLKIGANAFYALEGARESGLERHFLDPADLRAMIRASQGPAESFIDPLNHVPLALYRDTPGLSPRNADLGPGREFIGTNGNDLVEDTRVRNGSVPESVTSSRFAGRGGNDVINAGKGNDTIFGGPGHDSLAGGLDRDLIYGQSGNDVLFGGSQSDRLFGGAGNDRLEGGRGADTLRGENGNDLLRGDLGDDWLWGGNGKDRLDGGAGDDRVFGQSGHDRLSGGSGNDTLRGGAGRDILFAAEGDDIVDGGSWSDRLFGAGGNDTLIGGQGHDLLLGGPGADRISGGPGTDRSFGGGGGDVFVFRPPDLRDWDDLRGTGPEKLRQLDSIEDFSPGEDQIALLGFAGVRDTGDLWGQMIRLNGLPVAQIGLRESNQQLLVHLPDGQDWADLRDSDSFVFL